MDDYLELWAAHMQGISSWQTFVSATALSRRVLHQTANSIHIRAKDVPSRCRSHFLLLHVRSSMCISFGDFLSAL